MIWSVCTTELCCQGLLGLCFLSLHSFASAQSLTVVLVNAQDNRPMTNRNVTVHYMQDPHAEGQKVRVGSDGRGRFLVPPGSDSFVLQEGPRDGKEPNRIAFTDCRFEANAVLNVQNVVREGKAFHNSCGKAKRAAKPGEIIFWGKPISWWTPDFQ